MSGQRPDPALLDALAVTPHPLEEERRRVADQAILEAWLDDDDEDDAPLTWRDVWAWLRGWWS